MPTAATLSQYRPAHLDQRLFAYLIDLGISFILAFISVPLVLWMNRGWSYFFAHQYDDLCRFFEWDSLGLGLLALPLSLLLLLLSVTPLLLGLAYALLHDGMRGGQSIGKRALGLMTLHLPTHSPCTYGQSLRKRGVISVINIIPLLPLLDLYYLFAGSRKRSLGDLVADTMVIQIDHYRYMQDERELPVDGAQSVSIPTLDKLQRFLRPEYSLVFIALAYAWGSVFSVLSSIPYYLMMKSPLLIHSLAQVIEPQRAFIHLGTSLSLVLLLPILYRLKGGRLYSTLLVLYIAYRYVQMCVLLFNRGVF